MSVRTLRLSANAIAHFFVDAVCASLVFGPAKETLSAESFALAILVYNTIAFSTQCVVGHFLDRIGRTRGRKTPNGHTRPDVPYAGAVSCVSIGFAALLPLPAFLRVVLASFGNSVFHVAGGSETLAESDGKAGPLGVFVAPGAMGLTLGTLFPRFRAVFAAGILFIAVWLAVITRFAETNGELLSQTDRNLSGGMLPVTERSLSGAAPETVKGENAHRLVEPKDSPYAGRIALLLLLAVAVRAIGGSAVSFPWKTGAGLSILLTASVVLGKALGGVLADRIELKRLSVVTVTVAAVALAFGSGSAALSPIGQFALNVTMPVTLWLLYRAMPGSPGFAFGLAASALWPGTIAGMLITLTGPWKTVLIVASFLFGIAAILISLHLLETGRKTRKPLSDGSILR